MTNPPPDSFFKISVLETPWESDTPFIIGEVHGLDFHLVEQFYKNDDLIHSLQELEIEWEDENQPVEIKVHSLSWFEGQMSFPETNQWDFPPSWEFELEIIK